MIVSEWGRGANKSVPASFSCALDGVGHLQADFAGFYLLCFSDSSYNLYTASAHRR